MTTAALYLRQSLDVQEGIERQRQRCAQLIASRGWTAGPEYVDNDTSASKARGPQTGWGRMLDGIGRDFDVVVAVDLDRLLRSTADLVALTDRGARVVTVDGEIDLTTADGEFRATMLAGIARFEVRRKSERQRRANAHRAAQGLRVSGRRPFGFEEDGITLRPEEAAAVAQGFGELLAGVPLAAIARQWNEAGFTTGQTRQARSGHAGEPSPWRADSVRSVLLNARYAGKSTYRGEIVNDQAEWPAIVPDTVWLAAKAMLENPARRTRGTGGKRLLSGLARCECGSTVHAGGGARKGVPNYRCRAALGHVARMAEPVDEYVSRVAVARLSRDDARSLLFAPAGVDTDSLRIEADGLRGRLDALAVDFADGDLTASQLRIATERLQAKLAEVEVRLADAGRVDVLGELVNAADVQATWDGLSIERKRAVIDALMSVTILPPGRGVRTFRPETVEISWR